ncbi:MAG: hypothetical protein RIC51_11190 [Erythrobacter sp.]|uniref:hypothetical protein n=1 Tax=Erythrobacter sp. TaxID=1042 RepID=UPI0032EF98C9
MRLLTEMIDQLSTTMRVIAGLATLCVMGFGAMVTFGVGVAAPQMAETFADRAQKVREKTIEARVEAERARALAKEGWGYDAGSGPSFAPATGPTDRPRRGGEEIGGWGEEG